MAHVEPTLKPCRKKYLSIADIPISEHFSFRQECFADDASNSVYISIQSASPEQLKQLADEAKSSDCFQAINDSYRLKYTQKFEQTMVSESGATLRQKVSEYVKRFNTTGGNKQLIAGVMFPQGCNRKKLYNQYILATHPDKSHRSQEGSELFHFVQEIYDSLPKLPATPTVANVYHDLRNPRLANQAVILELRETLPRYRRWLVQDLDQQCLVPLVYYDDHGVPTRKHYVIPAQAILSCIKSNWNFLRLDLTEFEQLSRQYDLLPKLLQDPGASFDRLLELYPRMGEKFKI
jgi:hypothetical protein